MTVYYQALDFDGANDYVDCGNDASLRITNNLSLSIWLECGSQGVSKYFFIQWATGERSFAITTSPSSNKKIIAYFSDDGTENAGHEGTYATPSDVLPASGWAHVVVTFASGTVTLHVNGAAKTITSIGAAITSLHSSSAPVLWGGPNWANSGWLGEVCNVSIWDTGVLTQADVTALYNGGTPVAPDSITPTGTASLVSSWAWDSSLTYPDVPDNEASNDGTMTNMTSGDIVDSPWGTAWSMVTRPYVYNRAVKTFDGSTTPWVSPSPNADTLMTYHPDSPNAADYGDFVVTGIDRA